MKNGVPFDIAMDMDPEEMAAFAICFGEFDGGTFNWSAGQWEKQHG